MAERRMIAKTICLSDAFLDMPTSARCLYFTLLVGGADDDGFVNNPKSLMRLVGASNDDMNILIAKKFVLMFEDGLLVIKHWRIHNYIRSDRYVETKYKDAKARLELDENNAYRMVDTIGIPQVSILDTQDRIGKESIGKDSIDVCDSKPKRFAKPTQEEVQAYITEKGYSVDAGRFFDFYESKGWMVGKNKMKDWKACVRTWQSKEKSKDQHYEPTYKNAESVDEIRKRLFGKEKKVYTLDEMDVEQKAKEFDFEAVRKEWKNG